MTIADTMPPIALSESAARRISAILAGEAPGTRFRVSVEGGGCSGFQYRFGLDGAIGEDDLLVADHGVEVLVDGASLPFLSGARIDFVDELIGQSFKVINPNAVASCGCGVSFTI